MLLIIARSALILENSGCLFFHNSKLAKQGKIDSSSFPRNISVWNLFPLGSQPWEMTFTLSYNQIHAKKRAGWYL